DHRRGQRDGRQAGPLQPARFELRDVAFKVSHQPDVLVRLLLLIDGATSAKLNVHWYRSRIGLAVSGAGAVQRFHQKENIRMPEEVTTRRWCKPQSAKRAQVHQPPANGIRHSGLASGGAQLSGGQKQRVPSPAGSGSAVRTSCSLDEPTSCVGRRKRKSV
uniref:ABC transporter domain-containing protein n=1 Tax=Macrostomum lignano TaxID=282301 RepID=A0A1I8FKS1_9PLAT